MAKNIIKEIIIVLLLTIAIILILGVMLYEYIPANKIVPEKVSYTTPENIQEELKKDNIEENKPLEFTYEIKPTDLKNYQINEYVPGKKNPFEAVSENVEGNNTSSGNNSSSSGNNSNGNNTSSGYLPNHGTK